MEVYPRSSWFLLLLGFALIAATLQETTDCPTPDQVSCTSGVKCNEDGDCQSNEKCCANACYTKRCIPPTKGVQGDQNADGPSETDCRPYIEKALKELETGEAGNAQEEPSDQDENAEDVPTVEITDDSSHQEEVDGEADASEEDDQSNEPAEKQQAAVQESGEDNETEHDSGETPDEKEVDKSDEKTESDEETKTEHSREKSAEHVEAPDEGSAEDDSVEEQQQQKAEADTESPEQIEESEPAIIKREAPPPVIEIVPVQTAASQEDEESNENSGEASVEDQENEDKSPENDDQESAEAPRAKSHEELVKPIAASVKSKHDDHESQEKAPSSDESAEEGGCPPPEKVSCTEGELCAKHRQCGENQICCPNRCYRRRCVEGTVSQDELNAESESEESEEAKSAEKPAPGSPETGCPSPAKVSCTEGQLCSKHKQCVEGTICCPNKCYRRRCVPGTATSAELAEESDEDSEEEQVSAEKSSAAADARPDTGCPAPGEVSCVEGDICSKHKHCGSNEICCPNKCYRKRCTPGTPTTEDLEGEESSEEETTPEEEKSAASPSATTKDTGCPERGEVPCGGDKCTKNRHCGDGEICCANKCYRKVCVTGTPGSEEDEEESDEDEKEGESAEAVAAAESEEEGGCPSPDKVSCTEGVRCGEDEDCDKGEICCPNKCYNKRCIPGGKDDEEESAEELPPPIKVPPPLKIKVQETVKVEPKKEVVKPKQAPPLPPPTPAPTPKKIEKKMEYKKPEIKMFVKPLVVENLSQEEDDETLERDREALVEELSLDDIPLEIRSMDHVEHLLKLDTESTKLEIVQNRVYEETLKELKRLYENAIKPLEVLYKYRDLSNRHFGDAEIFSKPLILFMGPWSGGKSSIINYLTNNEYNDTALRTGAEPSPAYFNILMHGEEPEIIDGTELAADFTFSGLQKFGQGLEERLRGVKLPSKLLEKVNIVEIPGILEVRKQVSRLFPFNDACQWFIDRADIIFLVYDPSKLDVGPETEAILDQLKGREHQTRIVLNKADQVKPEELMRVQGALIWNISPLMSSPQPPAMYTTSLWSRPFEPWAPVKLLQAQERAFLRDFRSAVDRRVENKIASARRFAVRVRNHAKMVDCYLTTYYNHKSVFGNRKQVANEIIDHPQDYHIYEGLSTLTNISRYDLPDPEVYRDFFKLNPLYEFQQLSATCTYFRGCPINRLDIAIAYDLPELVGTYKRHLEEAITNANNPPKESSSPSKKTKKSAPGS